jgi:Flp pilus assembly protein protease CpaA
MNETIFYQTLITLILIYIAITDWQKYIIPNWTVLTVFVLIVLNNIDSLNVYNIYQSIIVLAFLVLFRYYMSKRLKRESMGIGDIKLITVLSIGLSTIEFITFIWISSLIALISIKLMRQDKSPFGFYLSVIYNIFLFEILDESKILEIMSITL